MFNDVDSFFHMNIGEKISDVELGYDFVVCSSSL